MALRREMRGEAYASSRPGQDQKLAIYKKHHGLMDAAFDRAREFRKTQHEEYDDRNREISDKLDAIKQRTDGEAKRQQDRMNEFSAEFDESLVTRRKEWIGKLAVEEAEVGRQSQAFSEYLSDLERAIEEEGEACRADTASVTEPLAEALRDHGEQLQQQVMAREDRHTEFQRTLDSHFCRLRKRLAQEAEARKKQCTETSADVKRSFAELSARLHVQDEEVRKWLVDIKTRLDFENAKRSKNHRHIMESFNTFVADLERHLTNGQQMKQATRTTLLGMQSRLRSPDPP
mmetsp:Transcript_28896/g.82791  ORF Transcript_28896/g.82791 Transcript_28896/m.82791 type:complete len:289 (-) Transcript_28896:78-944(-)